MGLWIFKKKKNFIKQKTPIYLLQKEQIYQLAAFLCLSVF